MKLINVDYALAEGMMPEQRAELGVDAEGMIAIETYVDNGTLVRKGTRVTSYVDYILGKG